MKSKAVCEIISVLGAVILFFTWVFQATSLARMDRTLAGLDEAEQTYRTYQSNNAIFNAIAATQKDNNLVLEQIRRVQTYNYGLGLKKMAEVTGTSVLIGYDKSMDQMQQYLEKVQAKAAAIRKTATIRKAFEDTLSLLAYAVGSLLTLLGSALKLFSPA